jgi:hypothetical protein
MLGCYKAAMDRFLGTGAPLPEGMKMIGRWHAPRSSHGCLVIKGTAEQAYEHAAEWSDLLEMVTTPVPEDADAGAVAAKAAGI